MDIAYTGVFVYAILGAICANLQLFDSAGITLVSGIGWKLALLAFAAMSVLPLFSQRPSIHPPTCGAGLLVLLASDYVTRHYIFYATHARGPYPLIVLGAGGALAIVSMSLAAYAGLERAREFVRAVISVPVLLATQLAVTVAFLEFSHHQIIFSDDHPSFLYRLQLLMDHFPRIPFYNPEWNSGIQSRDFFSTGVLNVYFLSWPLLKLWGSLTTIGGAFGYTCLIPYLFVFIAPWSVYFASRIFGLEHREGIISAVLAFGPALACFEWLLKYGTMAFSLSAALAPLALALLVKLLVVDLKPCWLTVIGAFAFTTLCFFWTLSALVFVPAVIFTLLSWRATLRRERAGRLLAFVLLFAGLNAIWVTVWLREAKVLQFVSRSSLPGSSTSKFDANQNSTSHVVGTAPTEQTPSQVATESAPKETSAERWRRKLGTSVSRARGTLLQLNPLIILFFLPGLAAVKERRIRNILIATLIWLLLVGTLADLVKPQLDLRRMLIPASFILAAVSGRGIWLAIERLIVVSRSRTLVQLLSVASRSACLSAIFGFLVLTPVNVAAIYRNRSDHLYRFTGSETLGLVKALRDAPGDGRTFFLGFVLHELESSSAEGRDGGHLAPLAKFVGRPMYASHFMHARWSTVDPIPRANLVRDEEGVEEFLDLMNVSTVVTFLPEWRRYCQAHSRYKQIFSDDKVWVFTRSSERSTYFQSGSGRIISQRTDALRVVLTSEDSVLKFRYQDGIRVSPAEAASLDKAPVFTEDVGGGKFEEVSFIRLKATPAAVASGQEILISYYPNSVK